MEARMSENETHDVVVTRTFDAPTGAPVASME
jgi:hypothetical protein